MATAQSGRICTSRARTTPHILNTYSRFPLHRVALISCSAIVIPIGSYPISTRNGVKPYSGHQSHSPQSGHCLVGSYGTFFPCAARRVSQIESKPRRNAPSSLSGRVNIHWRLLTSLFLRIDEKLRNVLLKPFPTWKNEHLPSPKWGKRLFKFEDYHDGYLQSRYQTRQGYYFLFFIAEHTRRN